MAKANKGQVSPKAAQAAPATLASAFGVGAAPVSAVQAGPPAAATVPLAVATIAGKAVTLTKSLTAYLGSKRGPTLAPALAGAAFTLGSKPYGVRAPQNVAQWQAITALLAAGPQPASAIVAAGNAATGQPLAAGFVGYCVRRQWLAVAQAA